MAGALRLRAARPAVGARAARAGSSPSTGSATVAEAERLVVDSGVSRLLVLGDDGQTVDRVHARQGPAHDPGRGPGAPDPAGPHPAGARARRVAAASTMPSSRSAGRRTHLAAVVDAERRFVGLATLEDVLESVVGDIIDESD